MKKILSLVLALALVLSLCASAQAAVTPKGQFPITDEPITLKVAVPVSAKVPDINTNELTLYFEEATGVDLDIIELNSADAATQINMLMNGGDLPDIILGYNFPYDVLCNYADAGLLQPLTPYLEEYCQNLYDVIIADLGPATLGYVTYDGEVWAMPSGGQLITNKYGHYYNAVPITFLKNLGYEEAPDTLDEVYEYLVAVRDQDANGNGDPSDEIGMISYAETIHTAWRWILQAYQYVDPDLFLKNNNGTVEFVANNELFKEGVAFLKKLVDEKLFDPASFTQDQTVLAALAAQEGIHIGLDGVGYNTNYYDTAADNVEYNYRVRIDNLTGPNGYCASMIETNAVRAPMVITSACEYPEIAVRLFDFFLSDETSRIVRVGFEGKEWAVAPEGVIGRDGTQAGFVLLKPQEWVQPSTNVIWDMENFIHSNVMNKAEASYSLLEGFEFPYLPKMVTPGTAGFITDYNLVAETTDEQLPQLLMNVDDSAEFNELKTLIKEYVYEHIALFALGEKSLDADWDTYVGELDKMGLARYIELAQASFDELTK